MGKTQRRQREKIKHKSASEPVSGKQAKGRKGKKGGGGWVGSLERELAEVGLRVHEVAADGSCFFRSIADQLEGKAGDHRALRQRIVAHITEQREQYEPFIEDDEAFDDYVERMAAEGEWAGNLELQAASVLLKVNLRVYQPGQPPWMVKNFPEDAAPTLHLSYHDGIHYNSVRLADDFGDGPPQPIGPLNKIGAGVAGGGSSSSSSRWSDRAIKLVIDGTGCSDDAAAKAALDAARGDVDAAIEALVAELHGGAEEESAHAENIVNSIGVAAAPEASSGTEERREIQGEGTALVAASFSTLQQQHQPEGGEQRAVELILEVSRGGKGRKVSAKIRVLGEEEAADADGGGVEKQEEAGDKKKGKKGSKKTAGHGKGVAAGRNTRCPCGSTKKYKNCCGVSAAARAARAAAAGKDADEEKPAGGDANGVAATLQTLYI